MLLILLYCFHVVSHSYDILLDDFQTVNNWLNVLRVFFLITRKYYCKEINSCYHTFLWLGNIPEIRIVTRNEIKNIHVILFVFDFLVIKFRKRPYYWYDEIARLVYF